MRLMDSQSGDDQQHPSPEQGQGESAIVWTASEYLEHQKSGGWYLRGWMAIIFIALLAYVFNHDIFSPIAVVVLGAILMFIARRKPRTLQYAVDEHGVSVGNTHYGYDSFTSFSVIKEDTIESILLFPQKRFAQGISLYFAPEDGQRIFDTISTYLPIVEKDKDPLDRFLHKIRF